MRSLFTPFFVLMSCAALAFSLLPAIQGLVQSSSLVVIGTIQKSAEIGKEPPYTLFRHLILVKEVLKGTVPSGKTLDLQTVLLTSVQREDPPLPLPPAGTDVLLFLSQNNKGAWVLEHPRHGCWEMKNGVFVDPMRPALSEVHAACKKGLAGKKSPAGK